MEYQSVISRGVLAFIGLIFIARLFDVNSAQARTPACAGQPSGLARNSADLGQDFNTLGLGPRVQGARGTCSVFVVTQALEFAAARARGTATRLSVEFLNWASNRAINQAEDGGFFSELWKGFENYGLCAEQDMPYQPTFDPAAFPSAAALEHGKLLLGLGLQLHWIKPWDVKTGLTAAHLSEIKRTLSNGWPVCSGLRWPKAEKWRDGVLAMAAPEDVRDGHSVLLVGFRDDGAQPGGGVLIFRNSAGPTRDGQMTYEYASAYMNDAAWIDHEGRAAGEPAAQRAAGSAAAMPSISELLNPVGLGPEGRNRRVSSNQRPGWHSENLDMTWLRPGESIEMPLLEGPGVITHMWFTSHAGWANELDALSLRVYWDGRKEPGVETPLGDFFAIGQGKPAVVESVPVQVSPTGALSCYWRMPFNRSARIVITNDNPDRGTGLYWQVDWTQIPRLPAETPYFNARYRQEHPAVMGRDYVLADLKGQGRYIGTVMSVTSVQDGWFGEGDDFFYIDGEEIPSLQGTGSEDYFNDAWGFRPRTSHWFGSPRWQGDSAGDSGVCYRWHLPDVVNFKKSLKVAIEHKGNHTEDTNGFFVERADFFSSVAFWYQREEPAPFFGLPPWSERRIPWIDHNFVRDFLKAKPTGGSALKIDTSGLFGARPVLLWPNSTPNATLTLPFTIIEDGSYAVRLTSVSGHDHGRYEIQLDGMRIQDVDFSVNDGAEIDLLLGTHTFSHGEHTITFSATSDAGHVGPMAVEMLRVLKLPPESKREVKTHHEAHFVRLAIGRAVYAYRLAYGQLPDSIDTLAKVGILAPRYLNDENNVPLRSRREGDTLVVESTQGEQWTHSWQGLDARR